MRRLEDRFSDKNLTEFQQARGILIDLPDRHALQQSVTRFFQGICDLEDDQYACTQQPPPIEDTLDTVRWFQHVHQAVYGNTKSNETRRGRGR